MSEIDVSKCDDFAIRNTENSDKKLYWCHRYDDYCNDFPNCDYKQLQQLKHENEELKKEVERNLKQQEIKDNYLHQIILKNEKLKEHKNKYYLQTLEDEATISRLVEKLEKIKDICLKNHCNAQIAHSGCGYDNLILQIIEGDN